MAISPASTIYSQSDQTTAIVSRRAPTRRSTRLRYYFLQFLVAAGLISFTALLALLGVRPVVS